MKLKFWLTLGAIVLVVFGIALAAAPSWMGTTFGMDLNAGGIMLARLLGAAFIFMAIVSWYARTSSGSEPAVRGIILASAVSDIIGFVVSLMATLAGTMNALGWLNTGLYLVFGLVFAYFWFAKPKS